MRERIYRLFINGGRTSRRRLDKIGRSLLLLAPRLPSRPPRLIRYQLGQRREPAPLADNGSFADARHFVFLFLTSFCFWCEPPTGRLKTARNPFCETVERERRWRGSLFDDAGENVRKSARKCAERQARRASWPVQNNGAAGRPTCFVDIGALGARPAIRASVAFVRVLAASGKGRRGCGGG